MHCKGFLITKELPSEDNINKILKKYYWENKKNKSGFNWDWFEIGGRYSGGIKLKFDYEDKKYEFEYLGRKRNNKLFICKLLDELKENEYFDESDYFGYLGSYDKQLNIDGGYYNDLKNFDIADCYLVITDDNYFNIRSKWNGENYIDNDNFDEEVKSIDLKDKFITIIDFHE